MAAILVFLAAAALLAADLSEASRQAPSSAVPAEVSWAAVASSPATAAPAAAAPKSWAAVASSAATAAAPAAAVPKSWAAVASSAATAPGQAIAPAGEATEQASEPEFAEFNIDTCSSLGKMPEALGSPALNSAGMNARVKNEMRYALYRPGYEQTGVSKRFEFVDETPRRKNKCMGVFPAVGKYATAKMLTSSDAATFEKSVGVCVLVQTDADNEWALEYAEYNNERNVPNFVAFKAIRTEGESVPSADCRVRWAPVCPMTRPGTKLHILEKRCRGVVDFHYGIGGLTTHNCSVADTACKEKVSSRGHMAPVSLNSWSANVCAATMMFLNVFPSRQPFDKMQWARREKMISKYVQSQGHGAWVWVVVGVSRQSDGAIGSQRLGMDKKPMQEVDVPSFVWTAVFDPKFNKATGWMCRNGLTEKHECYCTDQLSVRDLERRVGHRIFPQLEAAEGVNLSDGSHDEFWGHL